MTEGKRVVVVGAGISGLSVAWWLRRSGLDVTVLEKDAQPGGTMQTIEDSGWLVETGPNSALETTPLFHRMLGDLNILDERRYASSSSNKRYILRNGVLHPLPMSPLAFISTPLWSARGKLRLLKEPFVGRGSGNETIAEFVERRLGREFLEYAVNPFVAGVYAGDPERLSVRSAFPKLYALEDKYGGLIWGMVRGRKERRQREETAKDRARLFSFEKGMQTLPNAIARHLKERLILHSEVSSIGRSPGYVQNGLPRYVVTHAVHGRRLSLEADVVVLATPAYVCSKMVESLSVTLARSLDSVYYPPVASVFLGFRSSQFGIPVDGFGYLVPAKENRTILGTIWSSTIFPNRAPEGYVALTTFVGGSRQPAMLDRDDDALVDLVVGEIQSIMGTKGAPLYTKVIRWNKAIPQYDLGHEAIMRAIDDFENAKPGVFICSNYRGGISIGDCMMSAKKIADRILAMTGMAARQPRAAAAIG